MARQTLAGSSVPSPAEILLAEAGPIEAPMPNGAAVAAILAAAIGCAVLGLIVPIAEAFTTVKNLLNWWNPGGPLVGKTSVAVIAYFVSWFVLHRMWKDRDVAFDTIWKVSLVLLAMGFIGTFPLFFELFTAH
jgi:hypothetical protein